MTTDRKATADEVREHAAAILAAAAEVGVTVVGLNPDGTVVIHSSDAGYRQVFALGERAEAAVGCCVHIITDDVPAADPTTYTPLPRPRTSDQ